MNIQLNLLKILNSFMLATIAAIVSSSTPSIATDFNERLEMVREVVETQDLDIKGLSEKASEFDRRIEQRWCNSQWCNS
jgi:hypothetical protein